MTDDRNSPSPIAAFDDRRLSALGLVYRQLCDRQQHCREIKAAIDLIDAHHPGTLPAPALVLQTTGGRNLNLTCLTGVEGAKCESNFPLDAKEHDLLLRLLRYRLLRLANDAELLYRDWFVREKTPKKAEPSRG